MGTATIVALRVVLGLLLAGSLFVQLVMVPLLAMDLDELNPDYAYLRAPLLAIVVLGIVTIQVVLVCVWRLLTMVRRGTVFSHASFRYVDVVIGALSAASMTVFGLGVLLAPGEAVAPGIVVLIGGLGVLIAAVALIVLVLRMLLAQAVALDTETHVLQAELDEVI